MQIDPDYTTGTITKDMPLAQKMCITFRRASAYSIVSSDALLEPGILAQVIGKDDYSPIALEATLEKSDSVREFVRKRIEEVDGSDTCEEKI